MPAWESTRLCVCGCTSGMCCRTRWRLSCISCPVGILDQSAVWVDEMNYYDMRTDRNKGISPLSLRPSNPLGIDLDKYGPEHTNTHADKNRSAQSHHHKHTLSSYWVMFYIPKQKQTLPICRHLKYYANTEMAELPVTAAHREWKLNNFV